MDLRRMAGAGLGRQRRYMRPVTAYQRDRIQHGAPGVIAGGRPAGTNRALRRGRVGSPASASPGRMTGRRAKGGAYGSTRYTAERRPGRRRHDEPWPAGIHEAVCGDCGETFNPAGPEDLIHVYRDDGVTACGARGEYRGTWTQPDMGPGWLERTRRRRRPVGALRPEALADVVWCARHHRLEASIVIPPRCDEDGATEREVYRFRRGEA